MGMSASQARLLSITARMNDVEYKSQQISNTKVRLADESEQVANEYTKALNKTKLTFNSYDKQGNAVKYSLNSANMNGILKNQFKLVSTNGKQVPTTYSESQLYEMLESGEYMLQEYTKKTDADGTTVEGWFDTSTSSNTQLAVESDSAELAKAEAKYNAATLKINNKEKLLDNDLKALDTEHTALKTEQDSIKSLVKENVEKTFNLFS